LGGSRGPRCCAWGAQGDARGDWGSPSGAHDHGGGPRTRLGGDTEGSGVLLRVHRGVLGVLGTIRGGAGGTWDHAPLGLPRGGGSIPGPRWGCSGGPRGAQDQAGGSRGAPGRFQGYPGQYWESWGAFRGAQDHTGGPRGAQDYIRGAQNDTGCPAGLAGGPRPTLGVPGVLRTTPGVPRMILGVLGGFQGCPG